ncbi:acylphosphatase-2-like isoform X1 [Acyrthosiphon pisum]|uniref:acylphosphatase n=1 Tax=Acyrthosiphon pisum TaxID=7029 RepID=C4WSX7_ACYPI|nr:acylphosphatase-2-like [Acyrthosiphon pisum]XP_008180490.1 acylphosphatase-2-like isoform X1 [Acyrthosiphon pisum]BAH70997.1 ACYPI001708 [Acyrthosiphon pisum]|eukprot:NP_001155440.1 acylphosphatase-2-like [Acyrthosiphon pisum]
MSTSLKTVDFEVFGRVQKVFFRKCTQEHGKQLGLRGWCRNTPEGTVIGTIQGPSDKVAEMTAWLRDIGSPASRIDKLELKNEKSISDYTYSDFDIVRKKI